MAGLRHGPLWPLADEIIPILAGVNDGPMAPVCVSPVRNARSKPLQNMVNGKYQRRIGMTAPLRVRCANYGSVGDDLEVN